VRYALDTHIISQLWRQNTIVRANLEAVDPATIGLPAGVLAELLYGKYNNPDRAVKLDVLIGDIRASYPVLPFDAGAADWFGRLKHRLKTTTIQDRDLLIASTALAHGYTLVTNNTKHFQRIKELVLLDWTIPTKK
jgi:tRNA(fMet)-specific endonuclease VapC